MRDPKECLRDMREAITKIERYASRGRVAFEREELVQVWILYHLQVIGEAAARLGKAFHEAHPQLPWAQIVAMRNVLIHRYFGLDLDEVWKTVERDLPALKQQIETLLKRLEEQDHGG